jgi:preprotein translocase subunit SecE
MSPSGSSEVFRMLVLVAAVVAIVILVFFAVGYGLGRLLL